MSIKALRGSMVHTNDCPIQCCTTHQILQTIMTFVNALLFGTIIIMVVTSFKSSVITCPFRANVTQSEP